MRLANLLLLFLTLPVGAQSAESLLRSMTLEQKAGQLFMTWILSNDEGQETARRQMREWIREVGLGGVVLSLGSARQAQALIADLQGVSKVPLLVAGDFEGGVAFRLTGTTNMGNQMLVGATGLSRLARDMGRVAGDEGRALGFHWTFSPVLDVNVNPRNPIINVRSFGADPRAVARMGVACIEGIQGAGLIACAKHFPGHGDVDSDSHLVMPTVPGDRERLERIELVPFRAAVDGGVGSIMTAHLAVPGLGESPNVPATLSSKILTDLLREEMGFAGIVVTDALGMGGVGGELGPGEASVRALNAGNDMLLMPPDPVAARDAVVAAVRSGRVSPARLDEAVGRLLRAKERLGLLSGTRQVADWRDVVASRGNLAVAEEIARRGVTLVKDDGGLLPLRGRGLMITLSDQPGQHSGGELADALRAAGLNLGNRRLDPESGLAIETTRRMMDDAGLVLVAMDVRVRSFSGKIGLPPAFDPIVQALRRHPRAVVVSFGNPYLVEAFGEVGTYLCAYAATTWTERAVADVLSGRAPVSGRLPVGIPEVAELGDGLSFLPGTGVSRARPEREGFAPSLGRDIEALLERAVGERVFPGAVVLVARRGAVVAEVAVGRETYAADSAPIATDSLFDMASLTKVCATTPVVLRLVADGVLSLDQKVAELVPAFRGAGKEGVTIRHLLTHCAGLPAWVDFFRTVQGKADIVTAAAREPLQTEPGSRTVYSDLGLILLMACVERVTGQDFDVLAEREVFEPLGMERARFNRTGTALDAVPTEVVAERGGAVRGFVHDENAHALGGVSGHAGLFATAGDVVRIGLAFLGGGRGWLPAPLARQATKPANLVPGSSRGLGWDTLRVGGWGGSLISPRAFGHTGFTGTSILCDPRDDLCVVLLTNRVHPTRDNPRVTGLRAELHDLVISRVER
jgi:beta-glucosidase-like glycosyl hydrolase/CubicO group peptidase (beta-lactamase class C family)